jgi:hypothetical protein
MMDVNDFVFVTPHEAGQKNFHEARQNDKIDGVRLQSFSKPPTAA